MKALWILASISLFLKHYRKLRWMLSEIGSFEKSSKSNGKMAESEQLGLDK
ncbi:MAG: hypothetical protein GY820_04540 [Gammaproteobacteria bacterium]|nr:hypothetical protein [Gammaproteobacteria bacterium]